MTDPSSTSVLAVSPVSSDRVFLAWAGMRQAIALRTLSDESVISYRSVWDGWITFVLARRLRWDSAQSLDVREFLSALPARASARGIVAPSSVTQKRYYRVLREIYACARASGWIAVVPTDDEAAVSHSEAHDSLVFHRGQWQRLFAALPALREPVPEDLAWTDARNVALLLLMMQAALSVAELAALNVCDVRSPRLHTSPEGSVTLALMGPPWDDRLAPAVICVRGARGGQNRELVLGSPAQEALMAWLGLRLGMTLHEGADSPLFISRKGAGRLTAKTLFTVANKHIEQTLGPELGEVALVHAGPMTLRNSCIVRWLDAGTSDSEVLRRSGLKDSQALGRLRGHVVHNADLRGSASPAGALL